MLKRLRGSIGFEVKNEFKWTPKVFREKQENGTFIIPPVLWPVFVLKSKDGLEIAEIEDSIGYTEYLNGTPKFHSCSGSHRIATLERGIKSIKNLPLGEDGKFFDFDSEKQLLTIHDASGIVESKPAEVRDVIRFMRAELQVEIQNAINERSTLTEEERRGLGY
jgi:hypothetical protein